MADKGPREPKVFGRASRYAVVPVSAVRMLNVRTEEEVIDAQAAITPDMIEALEEMINAAKSGRLSGKAALAMGAVAW